MARSVFVGATAAAALPAALAAAVLVSAPFAGTTTAPLARDDARHGRHLHHGDHGSCRHGASLKAHADRVGAAHRAALKRPHRCS
jgi:hypothetical protein